MTVKIIAKIGTYRMRGRWKNTGTVNNHTPHAEVTTRLMKNRTPLQFRLCNEPLLPPHGKQSACTRPLPSHEGNGQIGKQTDNSSLRMEHCVSMCFLLIAL